MSIETSISDEIGREVEAAPDWGRLIESARAGDDRALGTMAAELQNYLLAVADQNLGKGLQAKFGASDIVQQSYVEAQESLATFSGSSEAEIRAWLKRIVLHNLMDSTRSYTQTKSRDIGREVSGDESESWHGILCEQSMTASWLVSRDETDEQLMEAVKALPPNQREVVEARHSRGQSYEQIGKELGVTQGAARNLWARAMQNLREMLVDHDDGQSQRRTTRRRPR